MVQLDSVDEVVEALGGTKAVATLFGRTDPAVSNWRKDARFPTYTFDVIEDELQKIGKCAPRSLWAWAVKHIEVAS